MISKPLKIYYLSSTHWDREWYKPFQGFRFKLVETMDGILKTLEEEAGFTHFMMDGQTAVLDDYLEIVPQNKERLVRLVRDGRISVGPWYTMPDEFLLSGESLIANLALGHTVSRQFGAEAMKFGYICDIFGHIAQMPQIFAGFGIHGAHLGRGASGGGTPAFFRWISPDGSSCITHKSPEILGYGSFCALLFGYLNETEEMADDQILEIASRHVEEELERGGLPFAVLMDGLDHQPIHRRAVHIADLLSARYGCPVVFDGLKTLTEEIGAGGYPLYERAGELNDTGKEMKMFNNVIRHTLSSRYDIKQANDRVQNLLEKWALPLSAISALAGRKLYDGYRETAYRHLLKNHAHDSICGCSVDAVHRDMHYRFRQAGDIADEMTGKALAGILGTDIHNDPQDEKVLRLYNPLPFSRQETVVAEILFEDSYPNQYRERFDDPLATNSFRILDYEGNEIAYQIISMKRSHHRKPSGYYAKVWNVYKISITAALPAMGYAQFRIVPSPVPQRQLVTMGRNRMAAENEWIHLRIGSDGTYEIKDKKTGKVYSGLGSYTDSGETGDGWFHVAPVTDTAAYSEGAAKRIEKISDGANSVTFCITTSLELPENIGYDDGGTRRSGRYRRMDIETSLTLGIGNQWVDIETVVHNTVESHYLKVHFPTGIPEDIYFASQAFTIIERKTGFRHDSGDWCEYDKPENNFSGIVYKMDGHRCGLAFIAAEGIHECEASEDKEGVLSMTLLRTFDHTTQTDGERDGLLLGDLKYRYRLMPFGSGHKAADFVRCQDTLAAGIFFETVNCPAETAVSECGSQLRFELRSGNILMSILKPSDGGGREVLVRFYNCSGEDSKAELLCPMDISAAYGTDMLGEIQDPADFAGNTLQIEAGGWKIRTYRISFK